LVKYTSVASSLFQGSLILLDKSATQGRTLLYLVYRMYEMILLKANFFYYVGVSLPYVNKELCFNFSSQIFMIAFIISSNSRSRQNQSTKKVYTRPKPLKMSRKLQNLLLTTSILLLLNISSYWPVVCQKSIDPCQGIGIGCSRVPAGNGLALGRRIP
jgi:hypothetical protein